MRLVTIKEAFFNIFDFPTEIMHKDKDGNDRPFLMVLSLKFRGKKQSFALPFRSNIQVNKSTKGLYFPLPRRHSTKDNHAHGLHYIKIFPIDKTYCNKFTFPQTDYNTRLINYISKNVSTIVKEAQTYLGEYENGLRPNYCTDIDRMISALDKYKLAEHIIHETFEEAVVAKSDSVDGQA